MAEHEVELRVVLGIPEVHGLAARLETSYRGQWGKRAEELVSSASSFAGMTVEELAEQLMRDERLRDVFWKALERAKEIADQPYREALARLVGAATDSARVDQVAFLLDELTRLQPLHLRVFVMGWNFYIASSDRKNPLTPASLEDANQAVATTVDADDVASQLELDTMLGGALLRVLASAGLFVEVAGRAEHEPFVYAPSDFGLFAISTLFGLGAGRQVYEHHGPNEPVD